MTTPERLQDVTLAERLRAFERIVSAVEGEAMETEMTPFDLSRCVRIDLRISGWPEDAIAEVAAQTVTQWGADERLPVNAYNEIIADLARCE